MLARLTGLIVAVVAACLLIVLGRVTFFAPENTVTPTMAVAAAKQASSGGGASAETAGAANANAPTSGEILAARTRLLDNRTTTGDDAFPPLSQGRAQLKTTPGVPDSQQLLAQWSQVRDEKGLLRPSSRIEGISSLPYRNAEMLEQPEGRDWRRARNDDVRYGGGWLIAGVVFALALFLFARGRIPLAHGFSGERVERFGQIERANHWMTASAFVVMALSGLVILYGKPVLLPVIGARALGTVGGLSAWVHMASAVPFVLGIFVMICLWTWGNLPSRLDWQWIKRGGGFLGDSGETPPARRFNAGQKFVFWSVVLGGLLALASGINLMFPFRWTGYEGMHIAQVVHAIVGLGMVAVILGHIYIGTIGMVGAIDAMWSGKVDVNWAKEHHKLWFDKLKDRGGRRRTPAQQPAE